jgi:hypothetical protein
MYHGFYIAERQTEQRMVELEMVSEREEIAYGYISAAGVR